MATTYIMHWESHNVAMLILSILLLIWAFFATNRFLQALKYRASALAGNIAVVKGIGAYPKIFCNATTDHLMALRQRRAPVAVTDVLSVHVPLTVEVLAHRSDGAAHPLPARPLVHLKFKSSVPCMLTVLGGVDIDRLKKVLNNLEMSGSGSDGDRVVRENKAILDFFCSHEIATSCGPSVLVAQSAGREVSLLLVPPTRDASRHLCILAVPKKSDRAESSLRSVDFGLLVIGSDKGAGTATDRGSYGEASTTAGDVEIGPIREADQPSAEVGTLTGALLVATSGRLFNCLEVFGSVESSAAPSSRHESKTEDAHAESKQSAEAAPGTEECVICLTDPKEVLLIPCRHLSVCRSCFQHVDKCPVCRAPYDQYMTVQRDREKQTVVRVPRLPTEEEAEI